MRAITHTRWPGWRVIILAVTAVIILAVGGAVGYYFATPHNSSYIPESVKANLSFSPLVLPAQTAGYTTSDYKFNKAEDSTQILTYVIHTQDGANITVSQYEQPPQFNEIPEYKDRFLSNVAKQYDTVETPNGTVYLGRMAKQEDKQLAVMIEKGLLILMNPSKELSHDQWHDLASKLIANP